LRDREPPYDAVRSELETIHLEVIADDPLDEGVMEWIAEFRSALDKPRN
jgi:hypothetical protein